MLRLRICFSSTALLLLAAAWISEGQQGAVISGTVELRDSKLESVAKGKDYSGLVISLRRVGSNPDPAPETHVTMLQKNKMFEPHILPILAGTTVDFPNADPIFHNAFSTYSGQMFDVGLYPPHSSRSVKFRRPGIVRVFCNIHPSMSAVILVLETSRFSVTAKDGSFRIDAPPGSWDLSVFHERATEQTLESLTRRIVVGPEGTTLPSIAVSEAGYLIAPHKNKYGKDYDPMPEDSGLYPGSTR